MDTDAIPVGISACLLGQAVRYDGGHRRDSYIVGTLGRFFRFVPCCPEVSAGLGVPRPTIRLVRVGDDLRAVGTRDPHPDVTNALQALADQVIRDHPDLCGFLLKARSPSCGMERVPVYRSVEDQGRPEKRGVGAFARRLTALAPEIPLEEEGRLGDPAIRDHFVTRVFTLWRFRRMRNQGLSPAALLDFHARHKLLLLAHHRPGYVALGRLLAARAGDRDLEAVARDYLTGLTETLRHPATRGRNTDVLQHLAGFLKRVLDAADRAEIAEVIDAYRRGQVPLIVPITLLRHHFRRHPHPYVAGQMYLEPHPPELALRNGV